MELNQYNFIELRSGLSAERMKLIQLNHGWYTINLQFVKQIDSSIQLKAEKFLPLKKNGQKLGSIILGKLENIPDKQIRVFKFGNGAEIKNVFFYKYKQRQLNVIFTKEMIEQQYALFGDGSIGEITIYPPDLFTPLYGRQTIRGSVHILYMV